MRFGSTEDQREIQRAMRARLEVACSPDVIRAVAGDPAGADAHSLRRVLTDLGIWGLLVDESYGGLGFDENVIAPILTEVGRAAVPMPVIDSVAFAAGVLTVCGLGEELTSGSRLCAVDPAGSGLVGAAGADLLLVGGLGGDGVVRVVDLRTARRPDVVGVAPQAGLQQIVGGQEIAVVDDPRIVRLAWLRGVLSAAAELVGLSQRMLDMTVGYVSQREQFGVPVGSFQSIKHHLADVALAVEFAGPMVASAGALLANGDDLAELEVSGAKALASDAARLTARLSIQCHGALAYTTEYALYLYVKRAWDLSASWGSAAWHRDRVASILGMPRSGRGPTG